MKIHAGPNLTSDGIVLDVEREIGNLIIARRDGGEDNGFMTRDEAAALAEQLVSAVEAIDRKADPYHGKRLTISVREDVSVAEIWRWQKRDLRGTPIDAFALYVLSDLQPQDTNTNIGAILAWGEANPGHPFALTLTDEPDHSDGSAF